MDTWAIIPAKPFWRGKSRLVGILDVQERVALNRDLFEHVFDVALHTHGAERTIVVTSDDQLLAQVERRLAHAVRESPNDGLNGALSLAAHHASEHGAQATVVLPSDLPDIGCDDIVALRDALGPTPACAIAPDISDQGTNALALSPPSADFFQFGPQSFAKHIELARTREITTQIVRRPGLAYDLDTPEAYRRFIGRRRAFGTERNTTQISL